MNKYRAKIKGYFDGWQEFDIEAEDKQDALTRAIDYCKLSASFSGGNFDIASIVITKKLKEKSMKK